MKFIYGLLHANRVPIVKFALLILLRPRPTWVTSRVKPFIKHSSHLPCQDAQVGRKWGPYIQLNGAHIRSPDGLCVLLSARSMSAPNGQPIDPYIWAPSRSHLSSPFGLPISAPCREPRWALCSFVRALDVRPKWAAHRSVYMGSF